MLNQRQIIQFLHERVRTLEDEENDLNRAIWKEGIDPDRSRMYLADTVNQINSINELLRTLEAS